MARNTDVTTQFFSLDSCYKSKRITFKSDSTYAFFSLNSACPPDYNGGIYSLYTTNSKNYLDYKSRYNDTVQITGITCSTYDEFADLITYQYTKQ